MPLYEYACGEHGLFDLIRPGAEYLAKGACPECGGMCARVMSAPHVRTMSPLGRHAAERNEKSRHEPHVCTSGCGHGAGGGPPRSKKVMTTASGKPMMQAYAGPRPWVVEHR